MTLQAIVEVDKLSKVFRKPFTGKRVEAVRAILENEFLWTGAEKPVAKPAPVSSPRDTADQDFF